MRGATNCPRPVAGRVLRDARSGEFVPLPCKTWGCSVCGPAKAYRLGLLAVAARPERFITLTRVGTELDEVHERLKTLSKALRRAGKGWEYLAVPEVHQNGSWHLHLLQKGDFIPQAMLSERAEAAGMGYVVDIRRIRGAAGEVPRYLCKYLTKQTASAEIGASKHRKRYRTSRGFWPGGRRELEAQVFGSSHRSTWAVDLSPDGTLGRCS